MDGIVGAIFLWPVIPRVRDLAFLPVNPMA